MLLTHSSLPHLGYLPFARAQLGLACPVYATVPIASMGRVACLEEAETWRAELDGAAWEVEDAAAELASRDDGAEMTGLAEPDLAERAEARAVKTRREKWVATADEVSDAFDAISRVKYESPTRLMGASALSLILARTLYWRHIGLLVLTLSSCSLTSQARSRR